MSKTSYLAVLLGFLLVLVGCPEGDDDVSGDDDTADDDDDITGDDDTSPQMGWSWGLENTVADANASLIGEETDDWAGSTLTNPGDLNGDGLDDLAIGAFGNSEGADGGGKVYFVFGRSSSWAMGELLATHPSIVGEVEDSFLCRPKKLGDVNGDGLADVALTPKYPNIYGGSRDAILFGRTDGWAPSMPHGATDAVLDDQYPATESGATASCVGFAGDIDGDGLDDWLLGNWTAIDFRGLVYMVSGSDASGEVTAPDDGVMWLLGGEGETTYVEPLGDVSGDGLGDFVAFDSATNYLVQGEAGAITTQAPVASAASATFTADNCSLWWMKNSGDLNGDGADDLVIDCYAGDDHSDAGVYLYFGRQSWEGTLTPADAEVHLAPGESAGHGHRIGDINGDGYDDLFIARSEETGDQEHELYIYFGRSNWPSSLAISDADVHIEREVGLMSYQSFLDDEHTGDFDGDGITDLFLRSAYTPGTTNQGGKVYVFTGRNSWPSELEADDVDVSFVATDDYQHIGDSYNTVVMDINADGIDDFLSASPKHPAGTEEGEVFVFFGQPR